MNKNKALNVLYTYLKSIFYPIFGRGNAPMWTHLWLTRKCNLNCKYCYVTDNNYPQFNTNEMIKAIDHLKDALGCNYIAFMGGEPLLRKDLPDLVQHMTDRDMLSMITTNGLLLTDEKIFKLCESGLDVLELSIDCINSTDISQKTITNLYPIIEKLIAFREAYNTPEILVNVVITKKNFHEIDELIEILSNKRISLTTGLYIPDPFSEEPLINDPLAFTTEKDLKNLKYTAEKILGYKKSGVFISHADDYFRKWEPYMRGLVNSKNFDSESPDSLKKLWKCNPGPNFLEIDCDGRLRYCSYINELIDPDLSLFDLDRKYYKILKPKLKKMLEYCNPKCLANCFFEVSEIREHPLRFVLGTAKKHLAHGMKQSPELIDKREEMKKEFRRLFSEDPEEEKIDEIKEEDKEGEEIKVIFNQKPIEKEIADKQ
ncbi:MAG: radical SAM protein [archaeon]|nr:radical SAM protein [archaeon]